ncbi:heparinase II/III family protein, partial [Verrucomicrobiota bacterium]
MTHTRKDIHGERERHRVLEALNTFDDKGMSPAVFEKQTLELLDIPGARDAGNVLQCYLARFASSSYGSSPLVGRLDGTGTVDEILRHRFTFHHEAHELPRDIDWEYNPGTAHWGHDLNRFAYLRVLYAAFKKTGKREYAEKAVGLILDWIRKTDVCDAFVPGKSAYVWSSYLNIGIHIEVWAGVLAALLPQAPDLVKPLDFLHILKSVHDQLHYLDMVVPEAGNSNWVTIGTRCQLSTLAFFPAFRDTVQLATTAYKRLAATLDVQVLPDGVQFELAPGYHLCVAVNLQTVLTAEQYLPVPVPGSIPQVLKKMLLYLRQTLTPDG